MAGDERVRHCTLCSLNVYNFAEMTRDEVRELLVRTEGRVCARLYRRADGTVLTRDCPTGLRALRRRVSRVAVALIVLSLPSLAFGGTLWKKPRLKTRGSRIELKIERVATPQPAVFDGVVRDQDGAPLPGITVAVRDEASQRELTAITDGNGAFHFASLSDGLYRVEATLEGFKPARMEHLQLKAGEVTHASVAMRFDMTEAIMVGAIAPDSAMTDYGVSTTFTQEFINKMPR
jgi:hypothetical protein